MREKSFRVYVFRILKKVRPDNYITKEAMEATDSIIRTTCSRIVDKALELTRCSGKKTVSSKEIATAVRLLFPDKNLGEMASKAEETFLLSEEERNGKENKAQTRESRAGLILSVSAVEKYIRRSGQIGYNISSSAPVYLAGAMESLLREFLQEAGRLASDSSRTTITVRFLFLAYSNLKLPRDNFIFLEGGVIPDNKPTKQIKRMQRSGNLLLQHAPFNRLVREITNTYPDTSFRFTADFFTAFQAFVESRLVSLMSRANKLAVHSGRETVYARDIALACQLFNETEQGPPRVKTEIPEASLRHLALRAGIRRSGEDSIASYRNYMSGLVQKYLRNIITCGTYHGVHTLSTSTLLEGLGISGISLTITPRKRKLGRRGKQKKLPDIPEEPPALSDIEQNA